jgi:hypothetical protein
MNPDTKSQDQALRRSGDTSLEQALFRNIQQNQNRSLPIVSPFLLQPRTQPISVEMLRSTLQAALDLSESLDLDLVFELDEEFEALERSVFG